MIKEAAEKQIFSILSEKKCVKCNGNRLNIVLHTVKSGGKLNVYGSIISYNVVVYNTICDDCGDDHEFQFPVDDLEFVK
jgi:hypothetical protein